MSLENGVLTPSALLAMQMRIQEVQSLDDSVNRVVKGYKPEVFNAMQSNQTARILGVENTNKDMSVKVVWYEMDTSEEAVTETCVTDCDFTGNTGGSDSQTYTLDACVSDTFSVDEKFQISNDIDYDTAFAQLFLQKDYAIAKNLNAKAIAFLEANFGTSTYAPSFAVANDADGIEIPSANWNKSLMSHIKRSEKQNRLLNPLLVHGGDFWNDYFDSMHEFLNADGKDFKSKLDAVGKWVFDLDDLATDDEQPIYQVSTTSYAIATKVDSTFGTGAPVQKAKDHFLFRQKSFFMPGVEYQMIMRNDCLDNRYNASHFAIEAKVKIFLNPKSVNAATNTGIVKFFLGGA